MSGCYKRVNFYDLCRLCAQNIQKNKIRIFEQDGQNQKNQLQSKIKKCLSINVKEDDFLPKVICPRCIKQLEICNAFREECLNSETMLSSHFKNYRHTEDFKKSGKVYIKDTMKSDMPGEPVQTTNNKLATNNFPIQSNQITVLQSTIIPPQKPEMCSKNQVTKSLNNLPNKKLKTQDPLHNMLSPQVQAMQLPYSIDMINEALKKAVQQLPKEILNKVIVNSNGEVINLSPPDPLGLDPLQIPQNMTSVIKNKLPKKRDFIRENRNTNSILSQNIIKIDLTDEDNIEEVPTNNKYYCKNNNQNNNVHQPASTPNPTVIFPVPQYQNNNFTASVPTNDIYPQQTTLNMPPSNPTVINVICSGAPEQNVPVSTINAPTSINMDDLRPPQNYIPAATPALPKSIKSENAKNTTNSSVKTEDQPKIHSCEVCSKTFKRREHLYQHIKLHTGFRPYQCTECKKSFVRKEHLLRHMVLHSGERNFSCDICTKSFSRHDNLLKHIRTHNKEPTYTCDVCQKVFIIKHYYDSHRSEQGIQGGPNLFGETSATYFITVHELVRFLRNFYNFFGWSN